VLDLFIQVNGVLTDLTGSLEFIIFDVSDAAKQLSPVQVFPIAGRETVDITALCSDPTPGHKLSTGRYVAEYTPDIAEPLGTHRICWYFKLTPSSPEQTFAEEFEVLPEATATTDQGYCFVSDIRAEGVTDTTTYPDVLIQQKIALASQYIDKLTGQWFEPRALTFELDGDQSKRLHLAVPIIAIDQITVQNSGVVDSDSYKVYNRHLTQRMTNPDDRQDPRVEYVHQLFTTSDVYQRFPYLEWPIGSQNITVDGVFGYTDYSGANTQGTTPLLICQACKLLVFRDLAPLCEPDQRFDARWRNRVLSMRTRDQSISLGGVRATGARGYLTGDEEIDSILEHFMAPIAIGRT
jgi:hypothetical protein